MDIIRQDLKDMDTAWVEAEELATDRAEWRRCGKRTTAQLSWTVVYADRRSGLCGENAGKLLFYRRTIFLCSLLLTNNYVLMGVRIKSART